MGTHYVTSVIEPEPDAEVANLDIETRPNPPNKRLQLARMLLKPLRPRGDVITAATENGLVARPHRRVVRSQSSRVELLRNPDGKPPLSANSVTSGPDGEQHFRMPDNYVSIRSPNYCWLNSLLVFVSLSGTAFVLWLLNYYGWLVWHSAQSKFCSSPACIRAANRLISRMDTTVDPCQDFYQFTCGHFLETGTVPDDSNQLSTLQEMQDEILLSIRKVVEKQLDDSDNQSTAKVKKLYASCINLGEDSVYSSPSEYPVFQLLTPQKIGRWPLLLGDMWDDDELEKESLIAHLAAYQVHSFFDIYITLDEKNPSQYTLQFYKGEPIMDKEWYELSQPKHERYLRSYETLLKDTILLLSGGRQELLTEVGDVVDFETKFAKISSTYCNDNEYSVQESNRTEDDSEEHRLLLSEVQQLYPEVDWTLIVSKMLDVIELDPRQKEELTIGLLPVSFQCRDFLPDLMQLIKTTSKRTLSNYLIWRFIYKFMPYISTRFDHLWTNYRLSVPNLTDERVYVSRWKQCVNMVNEGLGLAVGHMYIKQRLPDWSNQEILNLIQELKEAFAKSILQQDWIEADMQVKLLEKLEFMGSKVGFPLRIMNVTELEMDYEGFIIPDDHIFFNLIRLRTYEVWRELQKVFKPAYKDRDWLVQPLVVNAFHNPGANEIIFPLGILREPFYHPDYPKYLTYGNIGVVIGHEITHGFDDHGRRFDRFGNMTSWWNDNLTKEFRQKADCFVNQYSSYSIDGLNKSVDGNQTLGDNICDNSGLNHAWTAYQNIAANEKELSLPGVPYTHEQVFFITYGQIWCEMLNDDGYEKYGKEVHSPGRFRSLGVLQNSEDFSRAFQCPTGVPMNPPEKCYLWS